MWIKMAFARGTAMSPYNTWAVGPVDANYLGSQQHMATISSKKDLEHICLTTCLHV